MIGDDLAERVGVASSHFKEVRVLPCDVVAFQDVGQALDRLNESLGVGGLGNHHTNKGCGIPVDQFGVQERHVALDVPLLGKLFNSFGDGWSR